MKNLQSKPIIREPIDKSKLKNKCFSPDCNNQSETEFCPICLANGGFKPKDYISTALENSYSYHAPKNDQAARYEAIRSKAKELAYEIDGLCPNSREKSLAQTNLEQTVMWANKSIACNEWVNRNV